MKIRELINNSTFDFNVLYRIYQYIPEENVEGEMVLKFDSYWSKEIPTEILDKDITAINQSISGRVEIEYI